MFSAIFYILLAITISNAKGLKNHRL